MATGTLDNVNTIIAHDSLKKAYENINLALRALLSDQGTIYPPAAAPVNNVIPPVVSPVIGFETINKEIQILYNAVAKVSKVHSCVGRRLKEQPVTKASK